VRQVSEKDSSVKVVEMRDFIQVLPQDLVVNGAVNPEKRTRGIYEIVVYNSKIKLSGSFDPLNFTALDIPPADIQFDKAQFTVGINDLRGIEKQIDLDWNGTKASFNPGVASEDVVSSGINAVVPVRTGDSLRYNFSCTLDLKGSQLLYFTPMGKVTDVNMTSAWPDPSFNGAFLPDRRQVSEKGFEANWNVLHLNRNYPQQWVGSTYSVEGSDFGIDLILPVDNYQKSYRSIKYALLMIGFTFLVFFFIEVLNKVFIHPIQYILVGIALVVFYTLLLSLSEHIPFNAAFIVSAAATLILVAGYVRAILKSGMLAGLITGILTLLYGFTFTLIQLQDYALLIGSIGIFLILALVMYFSRKIDWYHLNLTRQSAGVPAGLNTGTSTSDKLVPPAE
jgi:inner membrane protein